MKLNLIYYLLISFCLVSCNYNSSNTFIIEGEVVGLNDSTSIFLSYIKSNNDRWIQVKDTAYVVDSKFFFNGNINELTAAYLDFENTFICLYLEPVTMTLQLDKNRPWEYGLLGTKAELEHTVLKEKLKSNEEDLYKELCITHNIIEQINLHGENESKRNSLIKMMESNTIKRIAIEKQMDQIRLRYISENKTSNIAPHLIYSMTRWQTVDIDTLKNVYENLPDDSKKTMLGRLASKQIEYTEKLIKGKNLIEGSIAPDFAGIDISGKKVKLSDFYSKNYVLLDFWASWCKPCLAQVPLLQEIHNSYTNKGLMVIGISLDEDKKQWANTVERYKLNVCPQILSKADNDYFASDISDYFGVEYIPAYFLINCEGKVVARWEHLREDEISFIENLLSNKD